MYFTVRFDNVDFPGFSLIIANDRRWYSVLDLSAFVAICNVYQLFIWSDMEKENVVVSLKRWMSELIDIAYGAKTRYQNHGFVLIFLI